MRKLRIAMSVVAGMVANIAFAKTLTCDYDVSSLNLPSTVKRVYVEVDLDKFDISPNVPNTLVFSPRESANPMSIYREKSRWNWAVTST